MAKDVGAMVVPTDADNQLIGMLREVRTKTKPRIAYLDKAGCLEQFADNRL